MQGGIVFNLFIFVIIIIKKMYVTVRRKTPIRTQKA